MIKKRIGLVVTLALAMSVMLIGCTKEEATDVSKTTKMFQATITKNNKEGFIVSPKGEYRESLISRNFEINKESMDEQSLELLKGLTRASETINVYYKDKTLSEDDATIQHVYRIETVDQSGNASYGATSVVPKALKYKGDIYTDTGILTYEKHEEAPKGTIAEATTEGLIPTTDNSSNFGSGYSYWVASKTTLHVNINGNMVVFKKDGAPLSQSSMFTAYVSKGDDKKLREALVRAEALNEEIIVRELKVLGSIDDAVVLNSLTVDGASLHADFGKGLSDCIYNSGTSGEDALLGGIVNTFLDAYDATEMTITINGKTLKTSKHTYDEPFTWYGAEENTSAE